MSYTVVLPSPFRKLWRGFQIVTGVLFLAVFLVYGLINLFSSSVPWGGPVPMPYWRIIGFGGVASVLFVVAVAAVCRKRAPHA